MAATLHEWRQSAAVLTGRSTHRDHYAQPGQEKRSLRLSAEALSRSSEQIGRMAVKLAGIEATQEISKCNTGDERRKIGVLRTT
jgi:hypothetical protein